MSRNSQDVVHQDMTGAFEALQSAAISYEEYPIRPTTRTLVTCSCVFRIPLLYALHLAGWRML